MKSNLCPRRDQKFDGKKRFFVLFLSSTSPDYANAVVISLSVFFSFLLRSITFCPQSGYPVMFFTILRVLRCNTSHQRIGWVAISEKGADRKKNFWDCQRWTPVVFEDVQTDNSLAVNVAMVDSRAKSHLRWLERVFGWEMNIKEENAAFVYWAWRSEDSWNPFVDVVTFGTGTAIWWGVQGDFSQLFLNSLCWCGKSFGSECFWATIFGFFVPITFRSTCRGRTRGGHLYLFTHRLLVCQSKARRGCTITTSNPRILIFTN